VTVAPFQSHDVVLLVSSRDASADLAQDVEAFRARLDWFGSRLRWDKGKPMGDPDLRSAFASLNNVRASLIVVIGGSITNPADPVLAALRDVGGQVVQLGLPFQPGTAGWLGRLATVPVLGLPTSGFFGRRGPLDLLLPWVLTGEPLTPALLGRLASSGLLVAPLAH
jgi:molybdenum cofactor cytidylyltransferase